MCSTKRVSTTALSLFASALLLAACAETPMGPTVQVLPGRGKSFDAFRIDDANCRGFAQNQLQLLEKDPSAKKLLYVLRTTLTGVHLLETGELEPDLTRLMDVYGVDDAAELVERKRAGERVGLDPSWIEAWRPRVDGLLARLDEAREKSLLPEEPRNVAEVQDWLLAVRRARFD